MKKLEYYDDYEDYDTYEDYQDEDYDTDEDSDDDEDYDTDEDSDSKNEVISVFAFISTWFIRIGLVLAAILFLAFLISGKLLTAILYLCGLAVAFVFGYGFMYCLEHFIFSDNS